MTQNYQPPDVHVDDLELHSLVWDDAESVRAGVAYLTLVPTNALDTIATSVASVASIAATAANAAITADARNAPIAIRQHTKTPSVIQIHIDPVGDRLSFQTAHTPLRRTLTVPYTLTSLIYLQWPAWHHSDLH